MQKALLNLKNEVASFEKTKQISDADWQELKEKTTVLLMAGGEGLRFASASTEKGVNKNSFLLPNGDTMIEMCIRQYRDSGIKDFVALLYHKGETIENLLGDGSKYGVNIRYSYDPGRPVGRGGAIKHAIEQGLIQVDNYLVVHNPDDVVLDYPGVFARDILSAHIQGETSGAVATVVVVEEVPHLYSAMKLSNSIVDQIEIYPMIPLPTHIGVTVFSPKTRKQFLEMYSYDKKEDFEKRLFPILCENKQLYSVKIPLECWIPVNNPKALQELIGRLGEN